MSKLWCIAIALGDPSEGMVVVSMQVNGLQEMAVAQAVSDIYRQTGTKLPLMGVNARELTREYLEAALQAMDEPEAKPDPVVQLVPKTAPSDQLAGQAAQEENAFARLQAQGYCPRPDEPA
jgi:hypothetical protein